MLIQCIRVKHLMYYLYRIMNRKDAKGILTQTGVSVTYVCMVLSCKHLHVIRLFGELLAEPAGGSLGPRWIQIRVTSVQVYMKTDTKVA